MSPTIRTLLTSFLIAAVAPVGLAVLEQPAFANNGHGGGNDGGHGGGNGGGHGNSGGDHGNSASHDTGHSKTANTDTDADTDSDTDTDTDGLAPNELGKLNGVLHASKTAIAHASTNSPIGTARTFGDALADFLDQPTEGEADANADADENTDPVSVDDLGAMMAKMTNKPVTPEQVEAVAEKLGIETVDEDTEDQTSEDQTSEDQTSEDPADDQEAPKLDPETAQAIADKANEIHGFTGDTSDDEDDSEDTATN